MNKIYYKGMDDLEKISKDHPEYTKLYVNSQQEHINGIKRTVLTITKNKGQKLCVISEIDYENIRDFYQKIENTEFSVRSPKDKRILNETPTQIKKSKQTNILKFFKQK
ncbi:hypothetical protein NUSPORA_00082 [Nucleospora cyclopteri]